MLDDYRETLLRGSQATAPDAALAREQLRAADRTCRRRPARRLPYRVRAAGSRGPDVEETAEALGIPAATVKTRLLRARRKLQEALAPEVAAALTGTFPFAGADCAALTERVLAALGR